LTFTVAGAAVATSSKTQNSTFLQNAAAMTTTTTTAARPTAAETAAARDIRLKETARVQAVARTRSLKISADKLTAARATAVARGVARKKLAAKAVVAKRAALAHTWRLPLKNPVQTSGFGYRWGRLHAGEDFGVPVGTPLTSMSTGTVSFAGPESGFGILVQIRYWDGTVSYYGHMSAVSVKVGQHVDPGQVVGESGNTGHSTGPHLHLEIHPNGGAPIDPVPWQRSHHVAG
jgi:murein DD-endopeptidase MepM/ murein hydrolase activator NlpD